MTRANSGIPLGEWSGSDATRELTAVIIELNEAAAKQTRTLIWLTWAIAIMTFALLADLAIRVF